MKYTLAKVPWDGVFKQGNVWVLSDGAKDVRTWYWAPLPWVKVSCLLHGYGWVPVR